MSSDRDFNDKDRLLQDLFSKIYPPLTKKLDANGIERGKREDGVITITTVNNSDLLNILKCSMCRKFIEPPIYQCNDGHIMCATCPEMYRTDPVATICPVCKKIVSSRSFAMEEVAKLVTYPCKNAAHGCPETFRLVDKQLHEENCHFEHLRCYFVSCQFKGPIRDQLPHFKTSHYKQFLVGPNQEVRVSLSDDYPDWIISAYNEFFYIKFRKHCGAGISKAEHCTGQDGLKGIIYGVEIGEKVQKFSYTIRLEDSMHPHVEYSGTIYDIKETLFPGEYSFIPIDTVMKFCSKTGEDIDLPVHISIRMKTNN